MDKGRVRKNCNTSRRVKEDMLVALFGKEGRTQTTKMNEVVYCTSDKEGTWGLCWGGDKALKKN